MSIAISRITQALNGCLKLILALSGRIWLTTGLPASVLEPGTATHRVKLLRNLK